MAQMKLYIGQKFNRLTILEQIPTGDKSKALCLCDCGSEIMTTTYDVRRGHTKSCGCFEREKLAARNKTSAKHGHYAGDVPTRTYRSWSSMHTRVNNPAHLHFNKYGGRGIKIAPRWSVFTEFLQDMGERPIGHSLDRIDNNGDYTPDNCRWATPKMQANNRRNSRKVAQ